MTQFEPVVSIVSITYNHEKFISKMIEGVLMQQTTFPIELIVAEDCSTDRTRDIILEYQKTHPELIKVIISDKNIGAAANERRAILAAKGKYIAFCEGDDYWTEPLKLQRQVDFLEKNPGYCVCFHRCNHYNDESNVWVEDNCGQFFNSNSIDGITITTEMFFKQWITQPLTMVLRKNALDMSLYNRYKYYRDTHQIYHLLEVGKAYLFAFDGGVRIVHQNGMYSMNSLVSKCEMAIPIACELYKKNKTKETKQYYIDILQWSFYEYSDSMNNKTKALSISLRLLIITRNFKKLGNNLKRLLK